MLNARAKFHFFWGGAQPLPRPHSTGEGTLFPRLRFEFTARLCARYKYTYYYYYYYYSKRLYCRSNDKTLSKISFPYFQARISDLQAARNISPCSQSRNVNISISAIWFVGELVCRRVGLSASCPVTTVLFLPDLRRDLISCTARIHYPRSRRRLYKPLRWIQPIPVRCYTLQGRWQFIMFANCSTTILCLLLFSCTHLLFDQTKGSAVGNYMLSGAFDLSSTSWREVSDAKKTFLFVLLKHVKFRSNCRGEDHAWELKLQTFSLCVLVGWEEPGTPDRLTPPAALKGCNISLRPPSKVQWCFTRRLSVCLSVSRITQNVVDEFWWNFLERCGVRRTG